MNKSESVVKLSGALAKAQAEMPAVEKNATNPFLKNRYADLGAVIEAAKPILARHGLSVVQMPVTFENTVGVTTMLMHESGEWLEGTILLPLGEEKGKSIAQVVGSVITYLRRYSYASILGMYADEDTDGNKPASAAKPAPMTYEQAAQMATAQGTKFLDLTNEQLETVITQSKNPQAREAAQIIKNKRSEAK